MIAKVLVLGLLLGAAPSYDETGHETVLYAVARSVGFDPEEAAILANSSQSLDEQDTTTAFSFSKALSEVKDWVTAKLDLVDAPHMISGQVFHALTKDRVEVEHRHEERIKRAVQSGDRKLALFYLGQYMHFVADEVVHPHNPLFGHFWQRHHPDRGEEEPEKLRLMMAIVQAKLMPYRPNDAPPPAPEALLDKIANAVVHSWAPSNALQAKVALQSGNLGTIADYDAALDREKTAVARDRVMRVLTQEFGKAEFYVPKYFHLDVNGDPPLGTFGFKRDINVLPFSMTVGELPALKAERKQEIEQLAEQARAFAGLVPGGAVLGLVGGPGGVALDPGLVLPEGLGAYQQILARGEEVVLETGTGTYVIEGITAPSFAAILRTVAAGEVPYISIGTDRSDRPGYAKVTLASTLQGTAEGAMLYRADVTFKALFAGYPLVGRRDLNLLEDPHFAGYPGSGGDSTRLWISSSGLVLGKDGALLRIERHGMRVLSETRLLGEAAEDPQMEAYVAILSRNWNGISERLPEWKAMEYLALECALALWARREHVPVHPGLWALAARIGQTPGSAPLVYWSGEQPGISGGVTLAPQEDDRGPARHFLGVMAAALGSGWIWAWSLLFLVALVLVPPLALLRLAPYRAALRGWSIALGVQVLLALPLWPLVSSRSMNAADRDFIAFLWVAAAPVVLAVSLRANAKGFRRFALGLALPFAAAWTGILLALLTAGAMGRLMTPSVERLISLELAPAGTFGAAAGCFVRTSGTQTLFVPAPLSITMAQRTFILPPRGASGDEPQIRQDARIQDAFMPWTNLQRVPGIIGRSRSALYTIDGKLPSLPPDD